MKPILTQKQSFSLDKKTIELGYLEESQLLDNVGKKIAQFILEKIKNPFNNKIVVVAGPGNNGADGIIAYYYLLKYGMAAELLLCEKNINKKIINTYSLNEKLISTYSNSYVFKSENYYIDSIFGIGLKRDVVGIYKEILTKMNVLENVISIDMPSGIYCDSGLSSSISISAKITLIIGYYKLGHFFNDGLEKANDKHLLNVGFPENIKHKDPISLIEKKDLLNLFPKHNKNVHKYKRGKLIVVAGSLGYSGACVLSTLSALSVGPGIIKVIAPLSMKNYYENNLIEPIVKYFEDDGMGKYGMSSIDEIIDEISWSDCILFGPGLSMDKEDILFKDRILKSINKPLILDASGFQSIIAGETRIENLPLKSILTPHYSEFSKIFNINIDKLSADPIGTIKKVEEQLSGRGLILKGPSTIIVDANKNKYIMDNGSMKLSVAGTGDVLSGICAGLLAQNISINDTMLYSTMLHAECAWQFNNRISNSNLTAYDLIEMLPYAMSELNEIS